MFRNHLIFVDGHIKPASNQQNRAGFSQIAFGNPMGGSSKSHYEMDFLKIRSYPHLMSNLPSLPFPSAPYSQKIVGQHTSFTSPPEVRIDVLKKNGQKMAKLKDYTRHPNNPNYFGKLWQIMANTWEEIED